MAHRQHLHEQAGIVISSRDGYAGPVHHDREVGRATIGSDRMRIGGGGNERWLVALPVCGLVFLTMVLLGGPGDALTALEQTFYAAWDRASIIFRH